MFRFLSRATGFILVAAAFSALVVDGTRSILGQRILQYSLGDAAAWLGDARYGPALDDLARLPSPIQQGIHGALAVPFWLAAAATGSALLLVGRPSRRTVGFSHRRS